MTGFFTICRRSFNGPRRSRGVAAVEFVIAVPLLLLAAWASAELGRAFVYYDTLSYAVRDSARFLSENAIEGTSGVVDVSEAADAAKNLAVYGQIDKPGGNAIPCVKGFTPAHVSVDAILVVEKPADTDPNYVRVTATYPYTPMVGRVLPNLMGSADDLLIFDMKVSVAMRAIS